MTSPSPPEPAGRRPFLSLAATVLLTVAPAGCGGDAGGSGRQPAAEFTRQAEAICARAKTNATADALRSMLDELAELNPPAVTEKEFEALLRSGRAYLDVISEPVEGGQLKTDDPLGDKFAADARAVGLPQCAAVPVRATAARS